MKKILTLFAFISAILAFILALLPIYKIAYFPLVFGVFCSIALWKINQKNNFKSTSLKVLLFILFFSVCMIAYQIIFTKSEVNDTKKIEQKEQQSEQEAIEELEGLELGE